MILGTFAGDILQSDRRPAQRIRFFLYAGIGLLVIGLLLHVTGVNPVVKRIWTPAWTLASGGAVSCSLRSFIGSLMWQVINPASSS